MLLVIDCCLRGEASATRAYYQAYLRSAGEQDMRIVELGKLGLTPLDGEALRERDNLIRARDFGSEQKEPTASGQRTKELIICF